MAKMLIIGGYQYKEHIARDLFGDDVLESAKKGPVEKPVKPRGRKPKETVTVESEPVEDETEENGK